MVQTNDRVVGMAIGFNHVGIGVADIKEGVQFYTTALDCRVVIAPFEVSADEPRGDQPVDVLGPPTFRRMQLAHLATPDGVGIELFQLIDPPHEPRTPPLEYWKSGVFHFCITDRDLEARLKMLLDHGGRQLSKIWYNWRPDPKMGMVYCCDPWGTIIEIYTHRYEEMYSHG